MIVLVKPIKHILFHIRLSFSPNVGECYLKRFLTVAFGSSVIAILIPLYEFVIYPVFYKYLPSIKIYQKFFIGMALQLATLVTIIVLDVAARKTYIEEHGKNTTINCTFHLHQDSISSINSKWIPLAEFLQSASLTMLSIGAIEFLASQSPYSMRGLVISTGYGSVLLFASIEYGIYWPFTKQSLTWSTGIISCEFWYLISVFLVLIITSGLFLVAGRWYKNRKREDVLPNEHIFAERYYSQVT
jgi:peptide/histidine transporter 3/4